MAPNKFEKHIKKQLEEREIEPSADAWNKINDQLGRSSEPKRNGFLWYGIAAGFIGILFASLVYFSSEDPAIAPEVQIVASPKISVEERTPEDDLEMKVEEDELSVKGETKLKKAIEIVASKNQDTVEKDRSVIAENKNLEPQNSRSIPKLSEEIIDVKIAEVMVQINVLESKDAAVTDAEIDSLLRQAQREILADKIFRNDNTVDATALLADVEKELDKSFRDEIFEALKDGFVKVRTAVADRNK